jgi:hypothetical protein
MFGGESSSQATPSHPPLRKIRKLL